MSRYQLYAFLRYDLPQGLRNLLEYAPIIWRTREWDETYLYELMAFKLTKMEKCIRFGRAVERKKFADQIKLTRKALERLTQDNYIFVKPTTLGFKRQQRDLKIVSNGIMQSLAWWD